MKCSRCLKDYPESEFYEITIVPGYYMRQSDEYILFESNRVLEYYL